MLDKLTRVGPSQTDLLTKNQKTEKKFEDLGDKNLKSDFKDNLKEQLKKEKLKEKPKDLKTDKKESQPGENKKKVAKKEDHEVDKEKKLDKKIDPTMILMNMVSDESEVKIPDIEENLAMIEESKIDLTKKMSDFEIKPDVKSEAKSEATQWSQTAAADLATSKVAATDNKEVQTQNENEVSLQSVPNAFQDKVMETLKKDRTGLSTEMSDVKLDQLKEKLAALQKETSTTNFAKQDAGADSKNENQNLTDQKSFKDDSIKNELIKTDSKHVGQNEFHSQLLGSPAQNSERSKSTEAAVSKTDATSETSVKDLLNQAHYLVTQGGGEVTLKMNGAEGMGDVHLKVIMTNGKMNIELNTQDKSVKKLIEESLSDLRSSLASRQISLEHVKINSVNATNTENNSQSLQNSNQQSGSESNQSKTFDQFQQQMQQQKNQNQEKSFAKNFLNEDRPVAIKIASVQKSAASQYYGLNKAQGLNAVA